MIAKMLLEDDRADEHWLYEAVRALVDRAIRDGREATRGRLSVAPSSETFGRFELRARFGGRGTDSWVTLMEMDELEFTYEAFLAHLPGAVAGP